MALKPVAVEAAGGLVVRSRDGRDEVLVIHRPAYDDWSLPKGKLEPGETHESAAIREVREETGWECSLGEELPEVRYLDRKGRSKRVRYWMMTPREFDGFTANGEVDESRWFSIGEAATLLSYDVDRDLVARFAEAR